MHRQTPPKTIPARSMHTDKALRELTGWVQNTRQPARHSLRIMKYVFGVFRSLVALASRLQSKLMASRSGANELTWIQMCQCTTQSGKCGATAWHQTISCCQTQNHCKKTAGQFPPTLLHLSSSTINLVPANIWWTAIDVIHWTCPCPYSFQWCLAEGNTNAILLWKSLPQLFTQAWYCLCVV